MSDFVSSGGGLPLPLIVWQEGEGGEQYVVSCAPLAAMGDSKVMCASFSGSQGVGKTTFERAVCQALDIRDHADGEIGDTSYHTTRGMTASGRSAEGIVLLDMQGQNAGDLSADLQLQLACALLSRVHVVCLTDTVTDSDLEMLGALGDAVASLDGEIGGAVTLVVLLRSWRRGLLKTRDGTALSEAEYFKTFVWDKCPGLTGALVGGVHGVLVPHVDDKSAEQHLSNTGFSPSACPDYWAAVQRVAAIMRETQAAAAGSLRTGTELAPALEDLWLRVQEAGDTAVPTLRNAVVLQRGKIWLRASTESLRTTAQPLLCAPFSAGNKPGDVTAAVAALVATQRAAFDREFARHRDNSSLWPLLEEQFIEEFRGPSEVIILKVEAAQSSATTALIDLLSRASRTIESAVDLSPEDFIYTVEALLVEVRAAVGASQVPNCDVLSNAVVDAARKAFSTNQDKAEVAHERRRAVLREQGGQPQHPIVIHKREHTINWGNGNECEHFDVSVARSPDNLRVDALIRYSGVGACVVQSKLDYDVTGQILYQDHQGGRKWDAVRITLDGPRGVLTFNGAAGGWGGGAIYHKRGVHLVELTVTPRAHVGTPFYHPYVRSTCTLSLFGHEEPAIGPAPAGGSAE